MISHDRGQSAGTAENGGKSSAPTEDRSQRLAKYRNFESKRSAAEAVACTPLPLLSLFIPFRLSPSTSPLPLPLPLPLHYTYIYIYIYSNLRAALRADSIRICIYFKQSKPAISLVFNTSFCLFLTLYNTLI